MINNKRKYLLRLITSPFFTWCIGLFLPRLPRKFAVKVPHFYRGIDDQRAIEHLYQIIIKKQKLTEFHIKFVTLIALKDPQKLNEFKNRYVMAFITKCPWFNPVDAYALERENFIGNNLEFTENEIKLLKLAHQNFLKWCQNKQEFDSQNLNSCSPQETLVVAVPFHLYNIAPKNPTLQKAISETFKQVFSFLIKNQIEFIPFLQHETHFNYFECPKSITYHTKGKEQDKLHIKESSLVNYVNIDTMGYSGWISYTLDPLKTIDQIKDMVVNKENLIPFENYIQAKETKYPQQKSSNKLPEDYLFVALQIVNDQVAKLADLNVIKVLQVLLSNTKDLIYPLVIKRHPLCANRDVSRLLSELGQYPNIFIDNGNIHDLIKNSRACLTVNSGVGFEALLYQKPVISTGQSDYELATFRAKNEKELLNYLKNLPSLPPIEIDKFLSFYSENYIFHYEQTDKIHHRLQQYIESFKS